MTILNGHCQKSLQLGSHKGELDGVILGINEEKQLGVIEQSSNLIV